MNGSNRRSALGTSVPCPLLRVRRGSTRQKRIASTKVECTADRSGSGRWAGGGGQLSSHGGGSPARDVHESISWLMDGTDRPQALALSLLYRTDDQL